MISTGPVIRKRTAISMAVFLALFMALVARLFVLQAVQAEQLQRRAQRQWTSESVIQPIRGSLYDRGGNVLAMSATAYIASVSPRLVKDPEAFARLLAPVLEADEEAIAKKAADTSKGGVTLKRQLSREKARELRAMLLQQSEAGSGTLAGLYLEEDSKRYYPMGAFAAQLLGITSIDGVGQSGLEASLDKYLSGKAGRVLGEVDGKGRELSYGAKEYVASEDGGWAVLTIDSVIQSYAEKAAREAMEVNGAKGIRILVMSPKTGEILAMCNKPDFDPNEPPRNDVKALNELMRNRLVTDAYEPGSTFKILTTAAALDSGVTNISEGFYCSGSVVVDGGRIRCWGNPHGAESMAEALANSCNPVFVELGLRLGVPRFYRYLTGFGLGMQTGVDISGEATGILIAENAVKKVDLARIGFGQSVAVTPIQLLTAASAAVNGGKLMKPYVVKEIYDAGGALIEKNEPTLVANPIREATSATMRTLLEKVVVSGGGRNAYIEGYRIGGKTGTAQVYKDGVISSDTHIGSFVGFAPIDDPQIAVLVIVDEAQRRPDFGSVTAAPFARDILEQSLAYLGVERQREKTLEMVEVPDVTGLSTGEATKRLKDAKLQYLLDGAGATVTGQMPAPGAQMREKSLVMLYVSGETTATAEIAVPDVAGKSVTEANRLLKSYGFSMYVEGSGVAVAQAPEAGQYAVPTSQVTVLFQTPGTE